MHRSHCVGGVLPIHSFKGEIQIFAIRDSIQDWHSLVKQRERKVAKGHTMNSHILAYLQAILEMFEVIKTYDNWARALLKQKKDAFVQQSSKWSLGPQADWLAGDDSNSQSCLQDRVQLWISSCVIQTTLKALLLWVYCSANYLIMAKLIISHT